MRTITSVCFGFALALSAFALTSAPTSALEAPSVTPIVNGGVTRVDQREEREERCEHVRRECRERHGDREEYRECVERHQCEHGSASVSTRSAVNVCAMNAANVIVTTKNSGDALKDTSAAKRRPYSFERCEPRQHGGVFYLSEALRRLLCCPSLPRHHNHPLQPWLRTVAVGPFVENRDPEIRPGD